MSAQLAGEGASCRSHIDNPSEMEDYDSVLPSNGKVSRSVRQEPASGFKKKKPGAFQDRFRRTLLL